MVEVGTDEALPGTGSGATGAVWAAAEWLTTGGATGAEVFVVWAIVAMGIVTVAIVARPIVRKMYFIQPVVRCPNRRL